MTSIRFCFDEIPFYETLLFSHTKATTSALLVTKDLVFCSPKLAIQNKHILQFCYKQMQHYHAHPLSRTKNLLFKGILLT